MTIKQIFFLLSIPIITASCTDANRKPIGYTEIAHWKDGKKAAVSLTYDGGTAGQFEVALPIMNRLSLS